MSEDTLSRLASTIAARRRAAEGTSYTKTLLDKGVGACTKKFGEEAIEAVIAALAEDRSRLVSEAADVLYHLLVMLEAREVQLSEVLEELKRREGQSGLAEKASREAGRSAS